MKYLFFFASIFIACGSLATLDIPRGLNSLDRETALEILGFGSASKILGNPFPLGGYSGVEMGITTEVIPTSEIARLGSGGAYKQGETTFSVLTMGKGLYNNVDAFLQFGLVGNSESMSNFGGQVRWGFYQAEYLPAFLSLILSANSCNFQNKIITNNNTADLVTGVNVDDATLYLGAGVIRTQGTFVGGSAGVLGDTGDNINIKENLSGSHYVAGINLKFSILFLAMQIDRYSQSNYSAKLGLRF